MRTARHVQAIGRTARNALVASGGHVESEAFGTTCYARAGDELIFFADSPTAMHPRIVVLKRPGRVVAEDWFDVAALPAWEPSRIAGTTLDRPMLRAVADILRRYVADLHPRQGFAPFLLGERAPFPLDRASDLVQAFAKAIDADDAGAIRVAGLPLLGLGPGLTPSGDDLVGSALFARRSLIPSAAAPHPSLATEIVAVARENSHPIAASLFADLIAGNTFAPLHDLAGACAKQDSACIRSAAGELVRIGSSSGFDMLAGFMIGIAGSAALSPFANH